jgi:hypothetical protein
MIVRSKIVTVLLVLIVIAAIAAAVSWIASPAAGGAVLMMLGIGAGVWFGADWGSARATETEEHRQKLISKPSPVTTYYDIDDNDPNEQQTNARDGA